MWRFAVVNLLRHVARDVLNQLGHAVRPRLGFVALGITCLIYAMVEIAHGYGFIGVFVAAVTLRSAHRSHDYHHRMHAYAEELERLLMMVLLVAFGAALVGSGLLQALTWQRMCAPNSSRRHSSPSTRPSGCSTAWTASRTTTPAEQLSQSCAPADQNS